MKIEILFCLGWNYSPRAASLAATIYSHFKPVVGQPCAIQAVVLIPGSGSVFEISVDGNQVFSKKAEGRFPEDHEILALIESNLNPK